MLNNVKLAGPARYKRAKTFNTKSILISPDTYPLISQPLKSTSKYLSNLIWHDYAGEKSIFGLIMHHYAIFLTFYLAWLCIIMQFFLLIMHELAWAPSTNNSTTEISFRIPFQLYMTWPCPQRFDFWPNYALIMQSFILIMHESASAPSKNIPTTEISF